MKLENLTNLGLSCFDRFRKIAVQFGGNRSDLFPSNGKAKTGFRSENREQAISNGFSASAVVFAVVLFDESPIQRVRRIFG
ncbi:MAG: hypothetical protein K2X38_07825 [Gemmataceae bacterium]|nr:hypothetical protein [Gemmataceae bacterium]